MSDRRKYPYAFLCVVLAACTTSPVADTSTTTPTTVAATTPVSTISTSTAVPPATTSTTLRSKVEWTDVGSFPMGIVSGALVEAVGDSIVVVQTQSTTVIHPDKSTSEAGQPPIPVQPGCCGSAVAISLGDRLLLVDDYSTDAWLLDPGSTTWTKVSNRPPGSDILGSTIIDNHLYVVTAAPRVGGSESQAMTLDLESQEWAEVESPPEGISVGGVTGDGANLYVAGVRQGSNNNILSDSRNPYAYSYDGVMWTKLPDVPIDGQASTITWVDGVGLLAWNYDRESARLGPGGEWVDAGRVPMEFMECYPWSLHADSGTVAICGGVALFHAATSTWIPVGPAVARWYTAVGDTLYEVSTNGDESHLRSLDLTTLTE